MQYTMLLIKSYEYMYIAPYQLSNNLIVLLSLDEIDECFKNLY